MKCKERNIKGSHYILHHVVTELNKMRRPMLCPKLWAESMLCCWLLSTVLIERKLHMVKSCKFSRSLFFLSISGYILCLFFVFLTSYNKGTMDRLSLVWFANECNTPPLWQGPIKIRKNTFLMESPICLYVICVCACACVCACLCM